MVMWCTAGSGRAQSCADGLAIAHREIGRLVHDHPRQGGRLREVPLSGPAAELTGLALTSVIGWPYEKVVKGNPLSMADR